jgi:hypothetical protein
MILDRQNAPKTRARGSRRGYRLRVLEGLEVRALLSGSPTVYTVNTTSSADVGSGSTGALLFAIDQANANSNPAGSVIQFDPSIFNPSSPQTIVVANTLALTGTAGPIVIDGAGGAAVSGNNALRVFEIANGVTATLSGFEITSGMSAGNAGGLLNGGALTLSGCTIVDNTAVDEGGGIVNDGSMAVNDCNFIEDKAEAASGYGGGISNFGTLELVASSFGACEESGSSGYGGGIYNAGSLEIQSGVIEGDSVNDGRGGGLYNDGTATISSSTFAYNRTSGGGAGAGIFNVGNLTVVDSFVGANSSGGEGGGIVNDLELSITYSTICENTASTKGGGIDNGDTMQATNVTIADNYVDAGGGGGGLFASSTATTLINTIIAENTQIVGAIVLPDDIAGTVSPSSTNNLIGTGGAGGLKSGAGDNQVGVANPGLASVTYNGGPTATIALSPASPAIDSGTNVPNSGTTDQRGPGFPSIYNGGIDIGAYELQPGIVTGISVNWGTAGTATLETAADGLRLLPTGRHLDLPWAGIDELQITLSQPEALTAADVTIVSQRGTQYGPVTVSAQVACCASSTFVEDIVFAHPIDKADRVTITFAGPGIVSYTRRLDVLPGDFSDNGVVNNHDVTAIRNEWKGKDGAQPTIFGEILGDGTVNSSDYHAARKLIGTRLPKLPKPGGKPPKAILARALATGETAPGPGSLPSPAEPALSE